MIPESLLPAVFIGWPDVPADWHYSYRDSQWQFQSFQSAQQSPITLTVPSPVGIVEHQTSGYATHHRSLVGVFGTLPEPLSALIAPYEGSCLGQWDPASFQDVLTWRERLHRVGLDLSLDDHSYQFLVEAFLPVDPRRLLAYGQAHGMHWRDPHTGDIVGPTTESFEDLAARLKATWDACRLWRPPHEPLTATDRMLGIVGPPLVGALVFENCD